MSLFKGFMGESNISSSSTFPGTQVSIGSVTHVRSVSRQDFEHGSYIKVQGQSVVEQYFYWVDELEQYIPHSAEATGGIGEPKLNFLLDRLGHSAADKASRYANFDQAEEAILNGSYR